MNFNKAINISDKQISEDSRTFIIAEAGVNHNGDISLAKEMVDIAIEAGVDAVKFQSFKADKLILKDIEKAPYQKETTSGIETQYEMLKRLELQMQQTMDIKEYCDKKHIIFLSTPFEKDSLEELDKMEVPAFKIAATDLTNIQFLRQVASKGRPIILSAGMCYLEEVRMALEAIEKINKDVILLQCTANYPIKDEEANIKVVQTLKEEFNILTGYSDHSQGVGASPYAVALGAKIIEKHFTVDKTMKGPDHAASVEPEELKKLVKDIRRVEKYLGNGIKMPTCSEQMTRKSLQKCLVAAKDIEAGELFTNENIVTKRTGGQGISALYVDEVIGNISKKHFDQDQIITLS